MDRNILIDYIEGEADAATRTKVEEWIKADETNRLSFARFKTRYLAANFPYEEASEEQMLIAQKITGRKSARVPFEKSRIRWYRTLTGMAAAVLVALSVNAWLLWSDKTAGVPEQEILGQFVDEVAATACAHNIYTDSGAKSQILLPDGSIVHLNSNTCLTFPDRFSGPTREVFLDGEAFFEVKTNPDTPMVVSTGRNLLVKVTGTRFNLKSYWEDECTEATLFSGKIDLLRKNLSGENTLLAHLVPGQTCTAKVNEAPVIEANADTLGISAWTRGKLVFNRTPMPEVLCEMSRWYGVDFEVKDEEINSYHFTAGLYKAPLEQVLTALKLSHGINSTMVGKRITLFL